MTEITPKQQVLVPFDFSPAADKALVYAQELARLFACEISIFHTVTKKFAKANSGDMESDTKVKSKLATMANTIRTDNNIPVNIYVFKGEIHDIINKIYQKLNAIAITVGLNEIRSKTDYFTSASVVSDYRDLRIPLIIVHEELPRKTIYENIILPLDFNRESKEKAAWSGYISTLSKSKVRILTRSYKDAYFAASLRNNIVLVEKLFYNLGVQFELLKEPNITVDIDKYAVEYAWMNQGDLIVVMATKEVAVDDLLFGLNEKKIIENKYKIPVMLINPRDDLYLPCGC